VIEANGARFVVELKTTRDARTSLLRGLLAEATLEARARRTESPPTAVVVAAPAVSDAMVESLHSFMRRVAPGQPWGVVDGRGRLDLFLDASTTRLPALETGTNVRPPPRASVFTDSHQWLLKVLLAPSLPDDLLRAPRPQHIVSTRELARLAGVSLGSAATFLATFEAEGYVERARRRISLVRRRELLETWRTASRPRNARVGMSWLVAPSGPPTGALSAILARLDARSIQAAVAEHAACEALGYGHVRGAKPLVYVARLQEAVAALEALRLTPSGEGSRSPDLFLDRPPAARSCFSGVVERGGLRVTDVVQCWLDVSRHPARGEEQAQVLWDEVLAPRLLEG
jgi:hypothetical protein